MWSRKDLSRLNERRFENDQEDEPEHKTVYLQVKSSVFKLSSTST